MQQLTQLTADARVRTSALISCCFLLASSGWLLWLYHLTSLAPTIPVDLLTMVLGYFMQAAGVGACMYAERTQDLGRMRLLTTLASALYICCLLPATLATDLAPVLAFGYLANLLCGYLQGHYLTCLAWQVERNWRGTTFGAAYAVSTLASWLLSALAGGALMQGMKGIATCSVLAIATILLVRIVPSSPTPIRDQPDTGTEVPLTPMVAALVGALVLLMSVTKGLGFGFPATDLLDGVSLELSRLLYGIGLLGAGLLGDRNRRFGALLCACSLVTPFLMLSLSGAAAPATLLWALGYLLFGCFAVYRVTVMADLVVPGGMVHLAGVGLLFGRVGDAIGTLLNLGLSQKPLALITVAAVLFACTLALFFFLYQTLYAPSAPVELSEHERFERFSARHDLSPREREVLRLLLAERTNAEIAGELFVSEATVKFHVRNLLKKTGCKNRTEIVASYAQSTG